MQYGVRKNVTATPDPGPVSCHNKKTMYQHASFPIGIYDSGLGGLSVVKQFLQHLPQESLIYVADSARVPYGPRPTAEILRYNEETATFLMAKGVKMLVCACNTSTAIALNHLSQQLPIPVMGLIQAGANLSGQPRRIAVLATEATIRSKSYRRLLQLRYPFAQIYELACPEFVPLIEQGHWQDEKIYSVIYQRLLPLLAKKPDQMILGCSHYPYLRDMISDIMGPEVQIVDPAERLLQEMQKLLQTHRMTNPDTRVHHHYYTTGNPLQFRLHAERYLEQPLKVVEQARFESVKHLPLREMAFSR